MGGGPSVPISKLDNDRIIVVTGATSGLGYEIAKWCAMMGATVIMACRSEQKTREAIEKMNLEFKEEKAKGTEGLTDNETLALVYMHVELSSFKSVVKFTEEFKKLYTNLHVLFLNAGYALSPYRKSEDGIENVLQVNYLSQFLMTAKLIPIMKQSGEDCRILLMSSEAHRFGSFDLENMNYTGPPEKFPQMTYYGNSKLFQIMQMYSMVDRLGHNTTVTVNCIHPGVVKTNFGSERTGCWACLAPCLLCCAGKTSFTAAKFSIDIATNPVYKETNGRYFHSFKEKQTTSTARNKDFQEKLWTKTWTFIEEFVTEEERNIMEGK